VEVATASAGVKQIQQRKKVEHKKMEYAEATYSIEAVEDRCKPMTPEILCNVSREQRASEGVFFPCD